MYNEYYCTNSVFSVIFLPAFEKLELFPEILMFWWTGSLLTTFPTLSIIKEE